MTAVDSLRVADGGQRGGVSEQECDQKGPRVTKKREESVPENVHSTEAPVHERLCVLPCGFLRCHIDT
jgi:hypothetical protein